MVQTGTDTTFTTASSGKTRKGGLGIFGEAEANYYVSERKAKAACDAVGSDDRWALAELAVREWKRYSAAPKSTQFLTLAR